MGFFRVFRTVHLAHHANCNDGKLDPDHWAGAGRPLLLPLRWFTVLPYYSHHCHLAAEAEGLVFQIKDLAGQAVYAMTNQFFLVRRAIFVFVWRVLRPADVAASTDEFEREVTGVSARGPVASLGGKEGFEVRTAGGETFAGDILINAAGLWSRQVCPQRRRRS